MSQVDPVVSLIVGAFGAALLGLFGAWIQGQREHSRWLREERYKLYVEIMQLQDAARLDMVNGRTATNAFKSRMTELLGCASRLDLLGPRQVSVELVKLATALEAVERIHRDRGATDEEKDERKRAFFRARAALVVRMQKELRAGWPWQRATVEDAETFREIRKDREKVARANQGV